MSYPDEFVERLDKIEGIEELVAQLYESENEVSILKDQIKTLAGFLLVNFGDEVGQAGNIFEGAVKMAVRLLIELRERRRAPQIESRLGDELDACRQQVKALRAERQAMSAECLEEARQLISFVNHLNERRRTHK